MKINKVDTERLAKKYWEENIIRRK